MNRGKIDIGRVKARFIDKPWWVHCPLCPIHTGFYMATTFDVAITWKDQHLVKCHVDDGRFLMVNRRGKGINDGR